MAQDYHVQKVQVWTDRETGEEIKDQHGNYKLTVYFAESAQGFDMTAKKLPEEGRTEYGSVSKYETKGGSLRYKFKREQKEDHSPSSTTTDVKTTWQPRDDSHIKAQWAIGQAVSVHGEKLDSVEKLSNELFRMVDRVKDSASPVIESGYAKAKQVRAALPNLDDVADVNPEEEINLDDIPF